MKFPALLTIWLAIGGLRRMTLACLGITVALLLGSLVLVLPGAVGSLLSPSSFSSAVGTLSFQLLPVLAAIMGLVTAALCLGVGTEITPIRKATAGKVGGDTTALVSELRNLLASERRELSTMQAACEMASRETATAGARLARLVSDAEAQLSSGIDQARQSGGQQSGDIGRAAEMVVRLERIVPMLARAVEPEASAAVITGAADAMERAISAAVSGAAGQIAALGDTATALRRDAGTLDKAAREIAMAGANAVTRVGEAAAHVEIAAAKMPAAGETLSFATQRAVDILSSATQRAVDTLAQASSTMSADSAAFQGTLREAGQSADMLRSNTASLHETGENFTQRLAGVGREIEARLASFPALSQVLGSQAGQLLRNAESLLETARGAAQSSHSAAESASKVDGVVTGLADLGSQITHAAAVLKESADGLLDASHSISTDGGEAATRIEAAARDVLEALPAAREIVGVSCTSLREGADALAREAAGLTAAGQQVAQTIAAENAQTEALAHALTGVSAELQLQVDSVASSATRLVDTSREMGTALQNETVRAAASIVDAAAHVERAVGTVGGEVAAAITQATVLLETTRDETAHASAGLFEQAAFLTDAGKGLERGTEAAIEQICQAMQTAIDEVTASGSHAASSLVRAGDVLDALDRAAEATVISGEHAAEQLGRLSAVCVQAEAQAAALPAAAAQIEAMVDLLCAAGGAMPHPDVLVELSRAATQLPEVGEALRRIVAELPAVLDSRTAAHDEILGTMKQTMHVLSDDVGETIRRLEDACAATDAAGAVMTASVAQVQSTAETVSQMAALVSGGNAPEDASPSPLRHLGGLEREAAALMREGEALAEAAATGRTEDVPVWLADRTAEILSSVDTTIHRLRSVATAVAFASDAVVHRARVA